MNIKLLLLFFGWSFVSASAQFGPQQVISTSVINPYRSQPFDIDNDGYIDILSNSLEDYRLRWFKNLDGQGNFGEETIIPDTNYYLSTDFLDLDSDGDKDLLNLSNNPRKIEWLENLDGLGNFGPVQVILENQSDYISSVKAEDIDNDGDYDLIVKFTDTFYDWIVWYENLDGMGTYGDEILLIDSFISLYPPLLADIDNDGYLDILTSHENNGSATLVWFKNLGNVTFGSEQEIHQFYNIQSDWTHITILHFEDINTDQVNDIVVSTFNADTGFYNYWIENLSYSGNFGGLQSISNLLGSYDFYDIDNDGDNDILGWYHYSDDLFWKNNLDGLGFFSGKIAISTEVDFPKDASAADFNGDGLLDVVSASVGDEKIAWYENTGVLGIEDNRENNIVLYPNPTNGKLLINSKQEIVLVEVYNLIGQKVLETKTEIDISNLVSGMYIVKFFDENGFSETHKVIKE